jgi:hypothetical protein
MASHSKTERVCFLYRVDFEPSYIIPYESLDGIRRIYFPLKDILGRVSRKKSILCFRDSGHGVNNFPVYPRKRLYIFTDKRNFLNALLRRT